MNNNMDESKLLSLISPEVFSAFLSAKNGSQCCLSCGSPHLFVPRVNNVVHGASLDGSSSNTSNEYVTYYKIQESEPATTNNCEYRVICTNCGFTSYYWAFIVSLWLETDWFPSENKGDAK